MPKQKDRHLLKQTDKQKSFIKGGFLFVFLITIAAYALGMAVPKAEAAFGINKQINYQGRLMDSSGQSVGDGIYQMQFKLYNQASGGSHIWSASTTNGLPTGTPADVAVTVQSGLFTVLLGDTGAGQVPLDIDWNNDTIFLGVKIATDTEMLPRKRLTAVPYALNAMMLQGQYASNTVDIAGGVLFSLNQTAVNSAVATRTALFIESLGTSDQFDYLVRMSNGSSDVFTVNRLGNVTTTGSFALGGNLSIQGIRLDAVGSNSLTSGAYLVGVYDEFTFSNATTVQAALKDLDTALGNVSSSAMGLTLHDVTSNGNTTTNSIEFYGGTSTGDLMPGAHLTYDLGGPGRRWDELWVRRTRIGTDSWTIGTDANNTFLISEDSFGNYFAITEDGRVGIGTSTPSLFDLEVNGTIGPSQHNLYDLGSLNSSWRNILASGTVSSTNAIFGSANIGSLSVTNLTIGSELDLSNLIWINATGTNSILGNLTVTSTLSLPNDSVTDAMVSDILTVGPLGNVSATSINSGVLGNSNVVLNLDSFGSITGSLSASQISLASINTSNNLDLQSYLNMLIANGRAYGGETIQTASGTVMVTAGEGLIASDPTNPGATVYYTSWATSTGIDVPLFEWLNIYLHYNAGNPTIVATTTSHSDDWTYFALSTIYNHGDGQLHIHDERSVETRPINRIVDFLEKGIGQIVTEGCIVSATGRGVEVSQCTSWYASFERIIPSFSTDNGDKFDVYYRNGLGDYVNIHDYTQWDNEYYDDGSGTLQTLGAGEFGVHWVYIHEHGPVSLLYGRNSYVDLAEAVSASAPINLPEDFLNHKHAFLIGAIIFEQGQNSPATIRDLRPVLVSRDGSSGSGSSSISEHNDLSGLQGGSAGEYYHLSATGFEAENELTFSSAGGNNITLNANGGVDTKVIINNAYAGTASLDIMAGALMLNGITRIDNSGNGFFNNLNLAGNFYVSGTALLTTLTVGDVTSTNLFSSSANITNLSAGTLNVNDLFWTNATGTNAHIDKLTGDYALFGDLIATNATFTQLVVMDNTTIENLTFGNATGGNLVTYGTVSSTFIYVANSILGYATAHNMIVDQSLRVGVGDFPIVGDSVAQFGGTVDSYLQVNLQNHSSGTNASSDYVATADIGDDESYYIDLGINSSNYSDSDFSIMGSLDGYLYVNSANLTIGTATSGSMIKFHAGGTEATDEVMRITSDHFVGIGTTTPSHTLDVDGDGSFTGLLTLTSATTSELFWGTSTGTNLYVTNLARLPANTRIGGISVCLLDGTNCPSSTSPDLQTVTNTGNTTTNWMQFAGGTSTADFWMQQGLKVDGYGDFNDFEFVNASGTNLFLSGMVSSTSLFSGDAILANTIMANATATNLVVETLRAGTGNFPVLGVSIAQFGGDFNNYLVVNARNMNAGDFASANFTASADVATTGNNFNTTMGIANSGFSSPFFTVANALDSYLMGNSSDLILVAATSSSVIKFAAGGTLANNEVMRITSDHFVGIGTTAPSHTLDVDGDGRFTGLLTLTSATTSELFWGSATGTGLFVSGPTRLSSNTKINGILPCLADGTNCPSSAASNFQTVTNAGNTTTHDIQFAGGTSTADFRFQSDVWIDGNVSSTSALFINATGTNLALLGYINSNLMPMTTDTYYLGDETHRWQGLTVNYVTSTNILATGYVSSSAMYINGQAVTTTVSTLDQVTTQGNTTGNAIQFGGGTSTGSILPGLADTYNLGSADYRWGQIFANSVFIGTSTPWDISESALNDFTISNNGTEKFRIDNAGNLLFATTTYSQGLDDTFVLSGNDAYLADKLGVGGSLYAGMDLRVGASSTIYSQSTLTKTGAGDFLFEFSGAVGVEEFITGFEGSFPPSGWTTGGTANWTQDNSTFSEGSFSARSGVITHNQISYIDFAQIFTSNGILQFDWKVSSEATYDYLMFCLDSNATCTTASGGYYARISAEVDWVTVSVPISAGYHTLRWAYEKDFSIDAGSDAGWIDNVRFTPSSGQSWRFFTQLTERFTIASDGNVGIGVSSPQAKLHVDGTGRFGESVTIGSQGSRTATTWTNSGLPSTGIESIRSLAVFNGYLYAGQGDNAGDGNIQICNPSAGGNPDICDVAADWSLSNNSATASQVNTMLAYKGRLYAGEGNGAGLGVVRYCRPELTGDPAVCDSGDWATANFPAGPQQINHLVEYNGYLYAANDTGAAGSAAVGVCNPAGGGNTDDCDNAADWTNVALPVAGYEKVWTLVVYKNRLYAGVGDSARDNDLFICDPATGGNSNRCDVAANWTRIINFNINPWSSIRSSAVYNGFLYQGQGDGSGAGDLMACNPARAGDANLCDDPADFNNLIPVIDNGAGFNSIPALYTYDGILFVGNEGSTGNGSVVEYNQTVATQSLSGAGFEAIFSFVEFNGYLYAGRGSATGNGQVWYHQRARTSSHGLYFEAGSSTGSLGFANDNFVFSHGLITEAGAYDLAESYPTLEADLEAGEVVVLDSNNAGYVKRAEKAYDNKILGVVSTKPGFLLSGTKEKDVKTAPIALVGRVPVKISLENGDIAIGDPLTSAVTPGYAMKATKPGMIIGHAMEAFSALVSTSTEGMPATSTNTGTVIMVVQTGYYFGSQETSLGQLAGFLGETTSTQIIQQAFAGDAYAIEQVAGGLINPQYADGTMLNDLTFAQLDVLIVKTAALIAGDLTVGGDTRLAGRVIVSHDTAGIVDLPIGQSWVEIAFATPFDDLPVVIVTPESDAQEYFSPWLGKFRIAKKTVNGFRIEVDEGACQDPSNCGRTMKFNWLALGVLNQNATTSSSTQVIVEEVVVEPTQEDDGTMQRVEFDEDQSIIEEDILTEEVVNEPIETVVDEVELSTELEPEVMTEPVSESVVEVSEVSVE